MNPMTRGALEMTAAMTISGTVGWLVIETGQTAPTVVFWRCVFGAVAMLVACALRGLLRPGMLSARQLGIMLLGGIALVLNWTLLFAAYPLASISVATVTYHTQPFMLTALGVLLFGERLTGDKAGWLLIAFAGMVLIVTGGQTAGGTGSNYLAGIGMALGAAFFYAIAAAIAKQLKAVSPYLIVLVQMLVGSVLLAPFAGLVTLPADSGTWALLVTIGVVHTGLMSTLLYAAIQKIPTSLVGALSFIYPVVAILVDRAVFGHRLDLIQWLGTAAILAAAAGMNFGWKLLPGRRFPHDRHRSPPA